MAKQGRRPLPKRLANHKWVGKNLIPPMLQHGAILTDWVRDDFPDLLWIALVVEQEGDEGARLISALQHDWLEKTRGADYSVELDGRLSSLEKMPTAARSDFLHLLSRHDSERLVPHALRTIAAWYPEMPGRWAFAEIGAPSAGDMDEMLDALVRTLALCLQRRGKALTVTAPLGWLLINGRLHLQESQVSILASYPVDPNTRSMAEAMLTSMYGATKALAVGMEGAPRAEGDWPARFWNANWELTPCMSQDSPPVVMEDADVASAQGAALEQLNDLWNEFMGIAFSGGVDLYRPARHEVVCALAVRCIRAVYAMVQSPLMWGGEHGAAVLRSLVETEILVAWLHYKNDLELYEKFILYGQGKQKLMRAHVEEAMGESSDSENSKLSDLASFLDSRLGGASAEMFMEVSVHPSFAGGSVNTRSMAEEVGMQDLYSRFFQPLSASVHGEWSALDNYVVDRCVNPLHRFHRIPVQYLTPILGQETLAGAIGGLRRVLDAATESLSGGANADEP
ncbi:DUF5677 domain-containing protein [Streptomyces viridiviolaceus]|uniref:DUF5677 domain-containing protein n=1 Tax=Streptomyces viridiviolaceus TaxID=68282 RepID=UPI0036D8B8F8